MASKQEIAKQNQGWSKVPMTCNNCKHFTSDLVTEPIYKGATATWTKEKNLRCGVGGFKVGKTNTCNLHEKK